MYYTDPTQIETLQLDHTSRCNLTCPQCARMWDKGIVNSAMPIADLTIDDYKILLEPFEDNKLEIFHCGNFGDVIASPTFDETYDYSVQRARRVKIATNGSARKTEWWRDLAQKGGKKNLVIFAFDGLEDTNHLYRIGANWNKAIKNAQSYIDAGGRAEWNFIEFKHNYHQIEEARKMAEDMGFARFNVKYTARFAEEELSKLVTKKGSVIEDRVDKNQKAMRKIKKEYKSFEEYTRNTDIECKFKKTNHFFVDMEMRAWPCCWFGAPKYLQHKNPQTDDFQHFFNLYGEDFNDMRKQGWDVLKHEFFAEYLERSWESPNKKFKRLYTCGRTCGKKFEFSSGYGDNFNPTDLKKLSRRI